VKDDRRIRRQPLHKLCQSTILERIAMTKIVEFVFIVPPAYSVAVLTLNEIQYNFLDSLSLLANITIRKKEEKKADIVKILQLQETWRYSFYWLLKDYLKQWTRYDFPFCTPEVQACLPFGNKRIAALKLCEKVLDDKELSASPEKLRYKNALELAGTLWVEEKLRNLQIAHQIEPNKKLVEEKLRQEISALKEWRNPYEGKLDCEYLSNLVATAISISDPWIKTKNNSVKKRRSKFRQEAWQSYLKAMSECLKAIRNGVRVEIDDKDVVYRFAPLSIQEDALLAPELAQGGKAFREIYAPSQKKFLSRRGRKSKNEAKITLAQQGLEPVFGGLKNNFDNAREAIYSQITEINRRDDKPTAFDQESQQFHSTR
jgi:uncharacterized FlaG/YvyC family protein